MMTAHCVGERNDRPDVKGTEMMINQTIQGVTTERNDRPDVKGTEI